MKIAVVFSIALIGSLFFELLSLPIPWLLGPIFFLLVAQFFIEKYLQWPSMFRNVGLIVVGVAIGQQFKLEVFNNVGHIFLYVIAVNIVLMAFAIILAYLTSKWTGMSMKTAITSTVPGGLSQLIIFAEEEKDIPLGVVTYFHVIRVISVVLLVPFIVSGHVVKGGSVGQGLDWILIPLLVAAAGTVWLGKKIKVPVPYFLTPIIFTIVLQFTKLELPTLPSELLHIAQLFIGAYIGLLLKPHMLKLPKKTLFAGIFSAVSLLFITGLSAIVVGKMLNQSFATSFLSTAPGGLDQMGILAAAVGANISVVTVFQLLRLLIVFLIILPVLKYVYKNKV